jgi:PilZ domain-containing protein
MDEKRTTQRNRVIKIGTMEFGGGAINCLVRNMSISGAALDVFNPVGIPEFFTLVFQADGVHMPCHVIWRKEKRIGVAFD